MKQGWEIKKLQEVCVFKSGTTIDSKLEKSDGEVIYAKVGDMNLEGNEDYITMSSRYVDLKSINQNQIIPVGSIIFPKRGGAIATNKKRRITKPTIVDLNTMALVPSKVIDKDYLFFWFTQIDLSDLSNGTSIPQINNYSFNDVHISYPKSLSEQQRIVAILDEVFAAIDKVKANAEKNLKNAKELFERYLQEVFETKGEGWEEKTLGEIADVEYGYTDKSTEEGDYRYIRITDIDKNGGLILEGKKYIKHSNEARGFLIQENDLLMARTGATFAKVLLYRDEEPSVFASYLIRINFKEEVENALYWYFTKTNYYWEQANSLQTGAAQPHFNGAAVKQVIFSYPKSVKEQKDLIQKFETLSIETKKLEAIYQQKINDLEELKKSVLQKAFAGELKENLKEHYAENA